MRKRLLDVVADWILYTRDSCSLCEQFQLELIDVLGEHARNVQVVDISTDPQLEERYGRKIPLLVVDGDIVCMYRVDRERIGGYL